MYEMDLKLTELEVIEAPVDEENVYRFAAGVLVGVIIVAT